MIDSVQIIRQETQYWTTNPALEQGSGRSKDGAVLCRSVHAMHDLGVGEKGPGYVKLSFLLL